VRRPLSTTFGLPLTGAASIAVPRASAAARTSAAAAGAIVVESMINPGATSERESRPCGPVTTSATSADPATIVKTMSRSARSAGVSAIVAPSATRGCALERVRL
jgi:hypothetical protein